MKKGRKTEFKKREEVRYGNEELHIIDSHDSLGSIQMEMGWLKRHSRFLF